MPPKQAKKKKGISLTPEKKKLLKQLIMQKAAEELKKQQEKEAEEKKKIVDARVPKLELDGLDKTGLEKKVKELYATVCRLEEEKYDWEGRLGRQTEEINELNIKVNDIKGKFSKPMLKKVAKTSSKIAQLPKRKLISATLKSTGPKFAVDDQEKSKPDWAADQHLKHKEGEEKEEQEEEEEEEEEE
jgi:troponin I